MRRIVDTLFGIGIVRGGRQNVSSNVGSTRFGAREEAGGIGFVEGELGRRKA